jgi:Ca2+/Na+ antiporter
LSKPIGGVLIAIGVSMPELTATMLSFQEHGVKMTEFGLALVIGGLGFAVTMIPTVSYCLNYGCRKKRPAAPVENPDYILTTNRFRMCLTRDLCFALSSLLLFYISLGEGTINVWQICLQLLLFVTYCFVIWLLDKPPVDSSSKKDDGGETLEEDSDNDFNLGDESNLIKRKPLRQSIKSHISAPGVQLEQLSIKSL